jgi:hypothetical protein
VCFSYACCGAVPYSSVFLEGIGCCLGTTLFPMSLLPLADGHGGVVSTALGGEERRGVRPCCTSADCTTRSSSCVDISVSSSIKSFSFLPLCLIPTNNNGHERKVTRQDGFKEWLKVGIRIKQNLEYKIL